MESYITFREGVKTSRGGSKLAGINSSKGFALTFPEIAKTIPNQIKKSGRNEKTFYYCTLNLLKLKNKSVRFVLEQTGKIKKHVF